MKQFTVELLVTLVVLSPFAYLIVKDYLKKRNNQTA